MARRFATRLSAGIGAVLLALALCLPAQAQSVGIVDPLLNQPKFIDFALNQNVLAGQAQTAWFTYTVPAGRMVRVEECFSGIQNSSNGASNFIGTATYVLNQAAATGTATSSFYVIDRNTTWAYFPAGTVITGYTANSGASNAWGIGAFHAIEFNAP